MRKNLALTNDQTLYESFTFNHHVTSNSFTFNAELVNVNNHLKIGHVVNWVAFDLNK